MRSLNHRTPSLIPHARRPLSSPTLRSFSCVLLTSTLYPRPTRGILGLCNELLGPVRRKGSTQSTYSAHWSLSLSLSSRPVCVKFDVVNADTSVAMATKKRRRRKVEVKRNFRDPTALLRFLLYLFAQWSHLGAAWRIMSFLRRSLRIVCCLRMRERRRSNNHKRNSPLIGLSIKPTDGVFPPPVLLFIGSGATRVLLGGTAGVHDSQSYVRQKKKEIESQLVFKEILSI